MIDINAIIQRVNEARAKRSLFLLEEDASSIKHVLITVSFGDKELNNKFINAYFDSSQIESIIVNALDSENYEELDDLLILLKKKLFQEKYNLSIGKSYTRKDDNKVVTVTDWTSNSIEFFISKSNKNGVDAKNWFSEGDLIKLFKETDNVT